VWKVGRWNLRSGQVKDWKVGTCCFHRAGLVGPVSV